MRILNFSEIKPFVRYARYMTVDKGAVYPYVVPCDGRFFYTVEGNGVLTVQGVDYEMKKGDILFFGAGTEYRIGAGEDGVRYLILNFDYTFEHSHLYIPIPPINREDFLPEHTVERACFEDIKELNSQVYLRGAVSMGEKLAEIEREYFKKVLLYENKISGILNDILVSCVRVIRTQTVSDGQVRIDRILTYIHENFDQNLTNLSLGKLFGFHPNYISALIKSYTGMPLHKYLLCVKMSHAIDLLEGSFLSVGEVAEVCGFCDIYYFSRYFKGYTGMSPLEYRVKNRNKQ